MTIYIALNKPYNVVCQFSPSGDKPTLAACVPVPNVYPVGRLDADSEGLLLLTDDGPLAHRLTDPRYSHPKTYWAQVEGVPGEQALQALRTGVLIKNYRTRPARARILDPPPELPARNPPIRFRRHIPTTWLEIGLREGRNRQIRHMTAAVGHPTLRLVRVAIGSLRLGDLAPGQWRRLTVQEVLRLRALTGLR